jgi:predicted Zn-dependent protease
MVKVLLLGLLLAASGTDDTVTEDAGAGPAALRAEGLEHLEKGNIQEAVERLEKARASMPGDLDLLLLLGSAYLKLEKFQQALNDYSAVLKKDPRHYQANLGRAQALIGLGDGQKAAGPARLAAELRSDSAEAWTILGDAYAHEGHQDYPRAAEAYRKALDRDPENLVAGMRLARTLSFKKEVEQAIQVLERLRKHHPESLELLTKLAESYYAIRKLDRARELVDRALREDPDNPEAKRVLGQIEGRQAYNFWVPVIALAAFPLLYLLIRWMKRGRVPKV